MLCPYLTWDSVVGKFLSPFERRLASSARDYNRYVHHLCMYLCTSLYEYITMAFKGCHSVKGLCRHCMFYPRIKLKRFTNGCRTWRLRCSLDMQLGNYVLLFNGVNQISANGKKGKNSPQKLTKQEEQDDWAFRYKLPGASELLWLVVEVSVSMTWPSDQMCAA